MGTRTGPPLGSGRTCGEITPNYSGRCRNAVQTGVSGAKPKPSDEKTEIILELAERGAKQGANWFERLAEVQAAKMYKEFQVILTSPRYIAVERWIVHDPRAQRLFIILGKGRLAAEKTEGAAKWLGRFLGALMELKHVYQNEEAIMNSGDDWNAKGTEVVIEAWTAGTVRFPYHLVSGTMMVAEIPSRLLGTLFKALHADVASEGMNWIPEKHEQLDRWVDKTLTGEKIYHVFGQRPAASPP